MKTSRKALSRSGRVATLLTLLAVVTACGSDNSSETATTSDSSTESAGSAPSKTSRTTPSERVALHPEREPVDGTDRTETGEVICGQGLLTIPLELGDITYVGTGASKAQIGAYIQGTQGATIKISDGPSVLYALIVNSKTTTIIPRELRTAPSSILGLDFAEWGDPIEKIEACASVE